MRKPRLLDLFCGAGGAAVGYHRAGFQVVGVDNRPQPNYPFEFHQDDALTYPLEGFDAHHASPPCQGYSTMTANQKAHPRLIAHIRDRISHLPHVIENVEGAKPYMKSPIMLCGSSFGLNVRRHRLFETNAFILAPPCTHTTTPIGIYGAHFDRTGGWVRPNGTGRGIKADSLEAAQTAMGIDWMTWPELVEAIPPAYTQFIGEQLLSVLTDIVPS